MRDCSVTVPVKAGPHDVGATVHPQDRRGHAPAASVPPQHRRHLRLNRPAARRDAHGCRAVQPHWARETRRAASASSPSPSTSRTASSTKSACAHEDSLDAGAPRLPASGDEGRPDVACSTFYRDGRKKGNFDSRHPAGAAPAAGQPDVRVPRRRGPPDRASRARFSASATSSWRRGCRSSSGAACPTTRCSIWRRRVSLRSPAVLETQVRRMLADPKADALRQNFSGQWLHIAQPAERRAQPRRVPRLRRHAARRVPDARPSSSSPASCARTATSSTC